MDWLLCWNAFPSDLRESPVYANPPVYANRRVKRHMTNLGERCPELANLTWLPVSQHSKSRRGSLCACHHDKAKSGKGDERRHPLQAVASPHLVSSGLHTVSLESLLHRCDPCQAPKMHSLSDVDFFAAKPGTDAAGLCILQGRAWPCRRPRTRLRCRRISFTRITSAVCETSTNAPATLCRFKSSGGTTCVAHCKSFKRLRTTLILTR